MLLKIKKFNQEIILPSKGTKLSAGYDIYCPIDILIHANETVVIDCGFGMDIPEGYYISLVPRSSMGKKRIFLNNSPATIDADFKGSFKVILTNFSNQDYLINKNDRIVQMILNKFSEISWEETNELQKSERADGGFGHTGR